MLKQLQSALDGLDDQSRAVRDHSSHPVIAQDTPTNARRNAPLHSTQLRSMYEQRIRDFKFPAFTSNFGEYQRLLAHGVEYLNTAPGTAVPEEVPVEDVTSQLDQELQRNGVLTQTREENMPVYLPPPAPQMPPETLPRDASLLAPDTHTVWNNTASRG